MSGRGLRLHPHWGLWLCLLTVAFGSVFFGGCNSSGQLGIEGTVTLDGKPLEKGNVSFRPQSGTASPSAGAEIVGGKFSIASKGGLLPGKFRVEITAMRLTDKERLDHFSGKTVTISEQYIPAKYNTESTLEAVVESGGSNHFEFTLTSK